MLANIALKSKLIGRLWCRARARLAVIAALGIWGMGQTNSDSQQVSTTDRMQPTQSLGVIGKLMADNRSQVLLALQHDPAGQYANIA
jgi:methyl-accepting chemotaxis protein